MNPACRNVDGEMSDDTDEVGNGNKVKEKGKGRARDDEDEYGDEYDEDESQGEGEGGDDNDDMNEEIDAPIVRFGPPKHQVKSVTRHDHQDSADAIFTPAGNIFIFVSVNLI